MATRLRNWAEDIGTLDENQAGFRQARSTADATQIFVRLQEDAELLQLSDQEYKNDSNTNRAQAILLDLKKAYPAYTDLCYGQFCANMDYREAP